MDFLEVLRPLRLGSGPQAQQRLHAAAAAGSYALFFAAFESHLASVVAPVGQQTLLWSTLGQAKAQGEGAAAAAGAAAEAGDSVAEPEADGVESGAANAAAHAPMPSANGGVAGSARQATEGVPLPAAAGEADASGVDAGSELVR